MEVACTMVCPKSNKEVITVDPDGQESQKCEKCEGECPKGLYVYMFLAETYCTHANTWLILILASYTNLILSAVEFQNL